MDSSHKPESSPQTANPAAGAESEDATVQTDVSYYRQSAAAKRLTMQAVDRARRAWLEALVLFLLAAGLIVLVVLTGDVAVRIGAAVVLAGIAWAFARAIGRAIGPRLLSRFEPGTASTVGFLVRLVTLLVVAVVAFRFVGVDPAALVAAGAVTAVIVGLAAQSTLGNVIAGIVLLVSRPFQMDHRVRLQSGPVGGEIEGTAVSIGLLYTTFARGESTIAVPNSVVLNSVVMPISQPSGIDLHATLRVGFKPSELQRMLEQRVLTPTRDRPHIALERVDASGTVVRITAVPVAAVDGGRLADEVLAVVAEATGTPAR